MKGECSMKKLVLILLSLMMVASCCFVACSPDNGDGGMTRQEQANLYSELSSQMLDKMDIAVPESHSGGNSPFNVVIPDVMQETQDEGAIHNIKFNAIDTAGITMLLGSLFENENFVLTNGIARFSVTYTDNAFGQVTQNLNLKPIIDKNNNKIYFEAMVEQPTINNQRGYTYAVFTYNFTTSTLIDCRFTMATYSTQAGYVPSYVDLMLTAEEKYMWYEPEEGAVDEFTQAVDASKEEFDAECAQVQALSADFSPEMQAYLDWLVKARRAQNPDAPSDPSDPSLPPEDGGMTPPVEEGTKPIVPENPENSGGSTAPTGGEVSNEVWLNALNLLTNDRFTVAIEHQENNEGLLTPISRTMYEINENAFNKWSEDGQGNSSLTCFAIVEGKYYRYEETITEHDKIFTATEITEDEYYEELGKAKINFNVDFNQDDFQYEPSYGCYTLSEHVALGLTNVEISFSGETLASVSCFKGNARYIYSFSMTAPDVHIPTQK